MCARPAHIAGSCWRFAARIPRRPSKCSRWRTRNLVPETTVDPAFTVPERPALWTKNMPLPEELDRFLGDRAQLAAWLAPGYDLWRRAMVRRTPQAPDPRRP